MEGYLSVTVKQCPQGNVEPSAPTMATALGGRRASLDPAPQELNAFVICVPR
jgi:hypothetical protein